jgi:hypothetical protein
VLVRLTRANHVLIHHLELLIGIFPPLHAELSRPLSRTIAVLLFLVEVLCLLLVYILLLTVQRVVQDHGSEAVLQVLLLTEELLPAMIEVRVRRPRDGVEVVCTLHVLLRKPACLGLDLEY